jgi:hypothetical protein
MRYIALVTSEMRYIALITSEIRYIVFNQQHNNILYHFTKKQSLLLSCMFKNEIKRYQISKKEDCFFLSTKEKYEMTEIVF